MHRSCHSDVGDGDMVSNEPLCLCELGIEDGSMLLPFGSLGIDDGLVWLSLEQWLHHILDEVDVVGLEPDRRFPQQPAIDLGTLLQVFRIV